jgi:hypothetical protein
MEELLLTPLSEQKKAPRSTWRETKLFEVFAGGLLAGTEDQSETSKAEQGGGGGFWDRSGRDG